jgi:hypothetical protein
LSLRVPIYRDVAILSPTEIAERVPKHSEESWDLQSQVKGGDKPRHYVFVGAGLVPALLGKGECLLPSRRR